MELLIKMSPAILAGFFLFIVWLFIMVSAFHFNSHVAPNALRRWADSEGYRILRRREAGLVDWFRHANNSAYRLYRVTLLEKSGREGEALVRLGSPHWFSRSVERCPIDVRWLELHEKPAASPSPPKEVPMWDRDLDRGMTKQKPQ
jgi:hypothetical protein